MAHAYTHVQQKIIPGPLPLILLYIYTGSNCSCICDQTCGIPAVDPEESPARMHMWMHVYKSTQHLHDDRSMPACTQTSLIKHSAANVARKRVNIRTRHGCVHACELSPNTRSKKLLVLHACFSAFSGLTCAKIHRRKHQTRGHPCSTIYSTAPLPAVLDPGASCRVTARSSDTQHDHT